MITDLPNVLTLSRIAAIPVLIVLASLHLPSGDLAACIIFALAGITDYLDGRLARSRKQFSDLGRMLDPIADKLFGWCRADHAGGGWTAGSLGALSRHHHHVP